MFDDFLVKATTSKILEVMVRDSSTGAGKTGLAHGDVTASYCREGATRQAISLSAGTAGDSYSSGKWCEVDSTNQKGLYQLHIPDAALASGVDAVTISLQAAGMIDKAISLKLIGANLRDGVRAGLTALPNAAADAAGGLPISDDGELDLDTLLAHLDADISSRSDGTGVTLHGDYDAAKTAAQAGDAMDLVEDAVDAAALKADAVTEIQSGLAPAGEYDTEMAHLDVDVSSRSDGTGVTLHGDYDAAKTAAQAGDAMDLVEDAVDAAALKADAVTEIQSGLAPAGEYDTEMAHLDVDVSSRSDGTGVTLHGDYDAAKTAAQAGNAMDLVENAVDSTALAESAATEISQSMLLALIDNISSIRNGLGLDLVLEHMTRKRTIELGDTTYEYIWNAAGDAKVYRRALTDNAGAAVAADTTGPINCSAWEDVP